MFVSTVRMLSASLWAIVSWQGRLCLHLPSWWGRILAVMCSGQSLDSRRTWSYHCSTRPPTPQSLHLSTQHNSLACQNLININSDRGGNSPYNCTYGGSCESGYFSALTGVSWPFICIIFIYFLYFILVHTHLLSDMYMGQIKNICPSACLYISLYVRSPIYTLSKTICQAPIRMTKLKVYK